MSLQGDAAAGGHSQQAPKPEPSNQSVPHCYRAVGVRGWRVQNGVQIGSVSAPVNCWPCFLEHTHTSTLLFALCRSEFVSP